MKAISVRNPWAHLIMMGKNDCVFKKWCTDYRGDLLICSTADPKVDGMISGYALCVVRLTGVIEVTLANCHDFGLGILDVMGEKLYALQLDPDSVRIVRPIPVKGKPNLFNVDDSLIELIDKDGMSEEEFNSWHKRYIEPLVYQNRRMKAAREDGAGVTFYSFYGWDADVEPVNNLYRGINSPYDLYGALLMLWCAETCAPRLRKEWTQWNPAKGQCSITAFLAQDIFGGKVYGILRPDGNFHCYNDVDGCVFDLTSEQFGKEASLLIYENNPEQFREVHFSKEEKRLRYELLKEKLLEFCNNNKVI